MALPTTAADLVNKFVYKNYSNVLDDDGDYFIEYGSEYMIQNYQRVNTNNTDTPQFTWRGRTTYDTQVSPMLIQIYNNNPVSLQAAPTTSNSASSVTPRATNVTVNTGSNTILVVCCSYAGNGSGGGGVSSMTYNSVALTKLDSTKSTTWGGTEIWYLINPTTGTNSLSVAMLANSNNFVFGAYVFDGVDLTNPFRTAAKSNATTGTSVTDTVSGVISSDYLVDSLSIDSTGHSAAATSPSTLRWALETTASDTTGASSTYNSPANGIMAWTWTTNAPNSHVVAALRGLTWETLANINTLPPDTDGPVTVSKTTNVANYYDSSNTVTFRTLQRVI